MKKVTPVRSALFVPAVLIIALLLSACNKEVARLPETFTYNPGASFTANINNEDSRRLVKCAVMFEVIDEAATTELASHNFVIRNAVLMVLGELTVEELTVNRDLKDISQRLVDQINGALKSNIPLIVGAYFTEFTFS